jgi:predicted nuclease of restriction endonuclease-like (RecB) superfamily
MASSLKMNRCPRLIHLSSTGRCTPCDGACRTPLNSAQAFIRVRYRGSLHNAPKRFNRTKLSELKLATASRVLPENATGVFKDSYLLDFFNLPETHSEADLQTGLLRNLRKFLMELGDGFAFVGEKVRVQVGNQDFELDLLFFHRDLQCLVAFELKTGRFEPEHMGKLAFYLEALDRDRKRPHENPSIGVLLCRTKDDEVVEYP